MYWKKPVRILQIGLANTFYGTENVIMNLYKNLDREIFQFDFLYDHKENKIDYENEIINLGGNIYRDYYRIHEKKSLEYIHPETFFDKHPEIKGVHYNVNNYSPYFRYIVAARRKKLPVRIIHSHNSKALSCGKIKDKVYCQYSKITSGYYANKLLACSTLAGQWNFLNNKFLLFPNAVEIQKFRFNEKIRKKIRRENYLDKYFVLGFAGRLHFQKNPELLIHICHIIEKKRKDVMIVILGTGELEEKMKSMVKLYGIHNIKFMGKVSNVSDWYQAMDMFLLPSRFEGFPVVLVEAQASGLKCLVSDKVAKEVKITDLVNFLPIDNVYSWTEMILNHMERYDRSSYADVVKKKGYDLVDSSKELMNIYYNLLYNIY